MIHELLSGRSTNFLGTVEDGLLRLDELGNLAKDVLTDHLSTRPDVRWLHQAGSQALAAVHSASTDGKTRLAHAETVAQAVRVVSEMIGVAHELKPIDDDSVIDWVTGQSLSLARTIYDMANASHDPIQIASFYGAFSERVCFTLRLTPQFAMEISDPSAAWGAIAEALNDESPILKFDPHGSGAMAWVILKNIGDLEVVTALPAEVVDMPDAIEQVRSELIRHCRILDSGGEPMIKAPRRKSGASQVKATV